MVPVPNATLVPLKPTQLYTSHATPQVRRHTSSAAGSLSLSLTLSTLIITYTGYTCSVDCESVDFGSCPETGTCLLAASQAARFRKARRSEVDVKTENLQMMLRRAASVVAQAGDEVLA